MKSVVYVDSLPITHERSLFDCELPKPTPGPRDLLVRIKAISVNPADAKVRVRRTGTIESPVVLGWDAAGVVEAVGADVSLFSVGDEVMYAGSIERPGSYAEYGLVDERITGRKPKALSYAEAAALPLTAITAWESLFDRLKVPMGAEKTSDAILIIGAAGGVGSIAVQMAKRLTALTVIGTASRPESMAWVKEAGAHAVIDHSSSLSSELLKIGRPNVRYVLSLNGTQDHWDQIIEVLAPQGQVCLIDDPESLDVNKLKLKSGTLHYEFMFTRSMFKTEDMDRQHELLNKVADMVDKGELKSTVGRNLGAMSASRLREAHALIESGQSIGKLVLEVS